MVVRNGLLRLPPMNILTDEDVVDYATGLLHMQYSFCLDCKTISPAQVKKLSKNTNILPRVRDAKNQSQTWCIVSRPTQKRLKKTIVCR